MSFRGVLKNGDSFLKQYNRNAWWWRPASRLTLAATGYWAKLALGAACETKVEGRDAFLEVLRMCHLEKRGLITVMNHTSVLDEPLIWGMLPGRLLRNGPNLLRWTLGADNICFKNKALGMFFSLGQVLSTQRFGAGPFQGSVDAAVRLLSPTDNYEAGYNTAASQLAHNSRDTSIDDGSGRSVASNEYNRAQWVHVFPEGFVHQPLKDEHRYSMRYFRWGVSRMILEATAEPVVLPIWTTGLDGLMPEDAGGLSNLRDRLGGPVHVKVGEPLPSSDVRGFRERWQALVAEHDTTGEIPEALRNGPDAQALRRDVAKRVRDSVLAVRDSIGAYPLEDPRFADADFWKTNTDVLVRGKSTAQKVREGRS